MYNLLDSSDNAIKPVLSYQAVEPLVGLLRDMISILHISDPHAHGETMCRLNNLARSRPACDVLALTGDCTSRKAEQLPKHWNEWPQRLKLSVPGNHDLPHTFDLLSQWEHDAPWVRRLNELIFIGVDTSKGFLSVPYQLDRIRSDAAGGEAIILLSHRWPTLYDKWVGEVLGKFAGNRSLLILHGHEHPREFSGTMWEKSAKVGALTCKRSKVCSSVSLRRGLGHLIIWENKQFKCSEVQGKPS